MKLISPNPFIRFVRDFSHCWAVGVHWGLQGAVTVDVGAGVVADYALNGNTAAAAALDFVYDTVNPVVTLTSAGAEYTNTAPTLVTVTFSSVVTGFTQVRRKGRFVEGFGVTEHWV